MQTLAQDGRLGLRSQPRAILENVAAPTSQFESAPVLEGMYCYLFTGVSAMLTWYQQASDDG